MTHSVRKTAAAAALSLFAALTPATVMAKDSFSVCWSIYVGWMPWDYGAQQEIVSMY
jgi:NitT/TauT family transport system substrate-binding protein